MSTNEQAEAELMAVDGWLAQFNPPTPEQYAIAGGARWGHRAGWKAAESALLARLSDPDDALVEAVHVAYWEGWRSAAADKPFPGDVAARAALAAVAARLAGGEQL